MQLQIIGKNGVGKRTLIELLQQYFQLELVTSRADVVIYLFDIRDYNSFEYLKNRYNPEIQNKNTYLVANKLDLIDRRKVSSENALKFSAKYGMSYHEISCITKQNVSHLIYTLQLQIQQSGNISYRQQKQSTISVLKFNRISLENANNSQTEKEVSPNSYSIEYSQTNNKQKINSTHSYREYEFNINQSQIHTRRVQTYIQDDQNSPLIKKSDDLNNSNLNHSQNSPSIKKDQFVNFLNQDTHNKTLQQTQLIQTERNLNKLNQFSPDNTPKNSRISKWIDNDTNKSQTQNQNQNSQFIYQRSPSKLQPQIYTSRSVLNEMSNSQDKFSTMKEAMKNGLDQFRQFLAQIEDNNQFQFQNYIQVECEKVFDSFKQHLFQQNDQKVKPEKVPQKKDSINICEISQFIKQENQSNNQIKSFQNNYYHNQTKSNSNRNQSNPQSSEEYISIMTTKKSLNQPAQSTNRNTHRNKSQTGIVVQLREQVNTQFNRTPERQLNYKSITPNKQLIKCVDLDDKKNEKLFSLQYKLKTGKAINIVMKKNDNLIKIAQESALKYKLEHNAYLQLLKLLKDKYRTILENQNM
ncbi:unnamed protein product [Paramecium sonneborni]|uniref:Uncharacterized protein n=1 Tax=Paramecium sonneborni TaxID=65129 RepID=A0A8S1K1H9_9CILI|nr:unnamed protein product [Paramecium sonneborni]